MKRLHLHFRTGDLDRSVAFYTALFGEPPTRLEADYAKWLLDDPRAHVSVSSHDRADDASTGLDHVGVSIETEEALAAFAERLDGHAELMPEKQARCCYAQSNKYWLKDPQGTVWELFQTYASQETYGAEPKPAAGAQAEAKAGAAQTDEPARKPLCCGPAS